MSTNVVVVTGRLGKSPEVRTTGSGKSVCSFSIAVDKGYGDKKKTIWVNCEAWDKTAEAIARMVSSGKRVTVTGSIDEDQWTDNQSGQKRTRTKVVANTVDIIDFANEGNDDVPF